MRPNEGYQLSGAMSKNLKLFQSTWESLHPNLGKLAGEHILRRCPGSMRHITIEKAT
jgi:hypothetical protein